MKLGKLGIKVTAHHSALCAEEAEAAVKELREALDEAGITLPSLGLHPVSLAREAPGPLVETRRCSVRTARRVAAAR